MSYSQELITINKLKYFGILLIILVLSILAFWYGFSKLTGKLEGALVTLIYMFIGFFAYPIYKKLQRKLDVVSDKILYDLENAQRGFDGENMVFSELDRILDSVKYTVLKNYKFSGQKFDIDTIIIGPKGVIIFEIKNYSRQMLFQEGNLYAVYEDGPKIMPDYWDPRNEIHRHYRTIINYLDKYGFSDIKVKKAIVFPMANVSISKSEFIGEFIISGIIELAKYFNNLSDDPKFTPEFCQRLITFFQDQQ